MSDIDHELRPALQEIIARALGPDHPDANPATSAERVVNALLTAESPLRVLLAQNDHTAASRGEQPRLVGDYFARLALETDDPTLRAQLFTRAEHQYLTAVALDTAPSPDTASEQK